MNNVTAIYHQACQMQARTWFLLGFLTCIAMELGAIYFQFILLLEPCPLCITQRLIVFSLALTVLSGAIHDPRPVGIRIYAGLAAMASLAGVSVATYHFVIQLIPHQGLSSCGPGASYILEHFKFADVFRLFLTGTGDCTQVVWTFLGLSMPFWVGLAFLGLFALCAWQFWLALPRMTAPTNFNIAAEAESP